MSFEGWNEVLPTLFDMSMPLLTELDRLRGGTYKHLAPPEPG